MISQLSVFNSAMVSLAPGVTPDPDGVRDADGRLYRANQVGCVAVERMRSPVKFARLVSALARLFAVDERTVRTDIATFLAYLQQHRLVSVRQSFLAEGLVRAKDRIVRLVSLFIPGVAYRVPRYPERRYPATAARVVLAALEAHPVTVLIGLLTTAGIETVTVIRNVHLGMAPFTGLPITTLFLMLLYLTTLIASSALHELAHYWMAQTLDVPVPSIMVRLGAAGVSHADDDPRKTAAITAAGPGTAAFGCLALATIAWYAPLDWLGPLTLHGGPFPVSGTNAATAIVFAAVGFLHLYCLTPFSSEGRRLLIALLRARRHERTGHVAARAD